MIREHHHHGTRTPPVNWNYAREHRFDKLDLCVCVWFAYHNFNLPNRNGCSRTSFQFTVHVRVPCNLLVVLCTVISIYQDVRVQWFQFASRYSRTMISIYQTISRIMISIYQRIFAYHDFNLPEYVRVPWFQFTRCRVPWFHFTRGCSRTMTSIYHRMFAYNEFNYDIRVPRVQFIRGCSRTMISIYQRMFAYHGFNLPDMFAYHDFNLPTCSRTMIQFTKWIVSWFQFTRGYHDFIFQRMFAYHDFIFQRMFAYQGFNLPELCSRTPFQFTALRAFDIISIYRKHTENPHRFWKKTKNFSPLRGEIVRSLWYAKVTIKCERP